MGRAVRGGEKGVDRSAGAELGVPPEVDLAVSRLERGIWGGDEGEVGVREQRARANSGVRLDERREKGAEDSDSRWTRLERGWERWKSRNGRKDSRCHRGEGRNGGPKAQGAEPGVGKEDTGDRATAREAEEGPGQRGHLSSPHLCPSQAGKSPWPMTCDPHAPAHTHQAVMRY